MKRCRPNLLMIPGAWHHGELFKPVVAHLRRNWEVHTPTVAGNDPDQPPNPDITLADMVNSIRDYIEDEDNDLTDLTIYAHSAGGLILTQLVPQIRDRVRRLVFHNAFVLDNGNRILDEIPPEWETLFNQADPDTRTVMLPFDVWRESFMQDADHAAADAAYRQLVPQPVALVTTPVDQTEFFALVADPEDPIPTSYLYATTDTSLPTGHMPNLDVEQPVDGWGWTPRYIRRLGSPRVIEIPQGSHEVMFTDPKLLAHKINEAARD